MILPTRDRRASHEPLRLEDPECWATAEHRASWSTDKHGRRTSTPVVPLNSCVVPAAKSSSEISGCGLCRHSRVARVGSTVNQLVVPASTAHTAGTPPFTELALPARVLRGIEEAGFTHCTPIQAQVLPHTLAGRDLAGQAQTGTGKTAAFLITVFTRLLSGERKAAGRTPTRALVVAPTRELALQIYEDARKLGRHTGLRFQAVYGGAGYDAQRRALQRGCDVVIGTPGRLIDFLRQGVLDTSGVEVMVLDEADRMFDMGFLPDLRFLLSRIPPPGQRQCLLFSATLTAEVQRLAERHLDQPLWVRVNPQRPVADGIEQWVFHVGRSEKLPLLLGLLQREQPQRALCFVNTKRGAEWLAERLRHHGYEAQAITGDLRQNVRLRLIRDFASERLPVLVATDVAARGLHVDRVTHVFNYDLPRDAENYVHRIGRTGRAGATGKAFSLACEDFVDALEPIESLLRARLPVGEVASELLVPVRGGAHSFRPANGRPSGHRSRGPREAQRRWARLRNR